ncbi:inositol monophosphatase family protein [Paenibacillus mangrovi]|uniref:inositol monophosphatase family protein n=1 Tax=Paenibacillus mangrovi TaxID=2931978 RepID=UPI0024681FAD|nr:inositol monophosphatase family protein [Paenibacillus mangrovi]
MQPITEGQSLVKTLFSVASFSGLAGGRMDAYWEFSHGIYEWMAGALLIEEAGGSLPAIDGKPFTWGNSGIIAGHEQLRAEIAKILAQ